ncbi:hypothetical protein [Paragemmobacter aquarius]|nr:hypothetical protein [Gemmobacter aquarius]
MKLLPVLLLSFLAACGAAGDPERPAPGVPAPGVTISGDARVGIVGTM